MKRGDIWTVAGGKDYASKPPPVVIVEDDSFDATNSIAVCAFIADETEAPLASRRGPSRAHDERVAKPDSVGKIAPAATPLDNTIGRDFAHPTTFVTQ